MKKTLAITALAFLVAGAAQAQVNATITATAVVAGPLGLTAGANLDFGTVIPGTARTIDPLTSASAGTFSLTGGANAQLSLTWTVTANLSDGGANTMPISYVAVYNGTNVQGSATALTMPLDATRRLSATGTVTPAAGQVATTYSADVRLDAAYTGN